MANQRKAGKKKIGVWLTDAEHERLKTKAERAGFDNIADFMRAILDDAPEPPSKKEKKG